VQVFAAARIAGILPADPSEHPRVSHVGFGLVLGEDGKRFRTRASEVSSPHDMCYLLMFSGPHRRTPLVMAAVATFRHFVSLTAHHFSRDQSCAGWLPMWRTFWLQTGRAAGGPPG
jgi:tRNA synthetases class I (R)